MHKFQLWICISVCFGQRFDEHIVDITFSCETENKFTNELYILQFHVIQILFKKNLAFQRVRNMRIRLICCSLFGLLMFVELNSWGFLQSMSKWKRMYFPKWWMHICDAIFQSTHRFWLVNEKLEIPFSFWQDN